MKNPTFKEVVNFVRSFAALNEKIVILSETKLESDLGITGLDGNDLLSEAESYFSVSFPSDEERFRQLFELNENEYLFGSEGLDIHGIGKLMNWIKAEPEPVVTDLSVGKFHQVLIKLVQTQSVA